MKTLHPGDLLPSPSSSTSQMRATMCTGRPTEGSMAGQLIWRTKRKTFLESGPTEISQSTYEFLGSISQAGGVPTTLLDEMFQGHSLKRKYI